MKNTYIIGSSIPALYCGIILARMAPCTRKTIKIFIESPSPQELTTSFGDFNQMNSLLGLKEEIFIKHCCAAPHYAAKIEGVGHHTYYSPTEFGQTYKGVAFHQLLNIARKSKTDLNPDNFNLLTLLAKENKYITLGDENTLYKNINATKGYCFESSSYEEFLLAISESLNLPIIKAQIENITPENGFVRSFRTNAGETILVDAEDRILDCTTSSKFAHSFDAPIRNLHEFIPAWSESSHTSERELRFSSKLTLDKSNAAITQTAYGNNYSQAKRFKFEGKLEHIRNTAQTFEQSWLGNCVTIGKSYAHLPFLLIDSIHLIASQLLQLVELYPASNKDMDTKSVFNKGCLIAANHIVDIDNFFIHHLLPDKVKQTPTNISRLDLFTHNGTLLESERPIIPDNQWAILMNIFGHTQNSPNALSETVSIEEAEKHLSLIAELYQQVISNAPKLPTTSKNHE